LKRTVDQAMRLDQIAAVVGFSGGVQGRLDLDREWWFGFSAVIDDGTVHIHELGLEQSESLVGFLSLGGGRRLEMLDRGLTEALGCNDDFTKLGEA
jgi:hypothetical protein